MIQLADRIFVGDSADEYATDLTELGVGAILNVAQDLQATRGWNDVEYMQVGLIDGPGNSPAAYCAAVAALTELLRRKRVLVVCHTGSRSLAVCMMYLNLCAKRSWDEWLEILRERIDSNLPEVNSAHRKAFDSVNWKALAEATKETR